MANGKEGKMVVIPANMTVRLRCLRLVYGLGLTVIGYSTACQSALPRVDPATGRALYNGKTPAGFSGLALDDEGQLWAIPERQAVVVRFEIHGENLEVARQLPIVGYPEGYDLESLAFIDGVFIIGTEHRRSRREDDPILVVEVSDNQARMVRSFIFPYGEWGMRANSNQGVEGVCVVDDYVLAAAEMAAGTGSRRRAPLGVFEFKTGRFLRALELDLTSTTGKISAIDCAQNASQIKLLAIERHYGIARLLHFSFDLKASPRHLFPDQVTDLTDRISPLPNLEGIVRRPQGEILMITDNQSRKVRGPTVLFFGKPGLGLFMQGDGG